MNGHSPERGGYASGRKQRHSRASRGSSMNYGGRSSGFPTSQQSVGSIGGGIGYGMGMSASYQPYAMNREFNTLGDKKDPMEASFSGYSREYDQQSTGIPSAAMPMQETNVGSYRHMPSTVASSSSVSLQENNSSEGSLDDEGDNYYYPSSPTKHLQVPPDKYTSPRDGIGWFHAKIKVEKSIHWSNNYQIQLLMFLLFVIGVSMTILLAENSTGVSIGLMCGGFITIVSCLSIILTFLRRPTWRKHPNPLIFFRSLCDFCLVIVLMSTELYKCSSTSGNCNQISTSLDEDNNNVCTATAGLTQFFLWASESWFFVMAIDMRSSLKSPFTDYKRNVQRYHFFVWASGM
jgi:hypothetical protein